MDSGKKQYAMHTTAYDRVVEKPSFSEKENVH